jgi:hypothetical protein
MWKHPLRAYREKHDLTLAACGALFTPPRTAGEVHKWENGRMPRRETRLAIAQLTQGEVPANGWEPEIPACADAGQHGAAA